jgi:DNA-binding transcriptional LysR family regulator
MAMDERFARIRLVVVDATTSSLLPQVVAGSLDLAVVNVPIEDPDLISEALFVEDPILVAPSSHPLAAKDRVTLADIAQHRLLLEPQGTGFRDLIDEGARAVGLSFEPQAEIDGMRLLASLAFQGFGAAILPASAAPGWIGGDWKRVPIDGLVSRTVGLTWRRRGLLSAPARAVREVLRDVVMAAAPAEFGIHPTAERAAALTAEATPRRPDGPTGNRRGPGGV